MGEFHPVAPVGLGGVKGPVGGADNRHFPHHPGVFILPRGEGNFKMVDLARMDEFQLGLAAIHTVEQLEKGGEAAQGFTRGSSNLRIPCHPQEDQAFLDLLVFPLNSS